MTRSLLSNPLLSSARRLAKPEKCYYCRNPFGHGEKDCCYSHYIPISVLNNISENGKIRDLNFLLAVENKDCTVGRNKASTFKMICRKCDGTIFSDYENPENYHNFDVNGCKEQKIMAQIAMKNYLNLLHKRKTELESIPVYQNLFPKTALIENAKSKMQDIKNQDFKWYLKCYDLAKKRNDGRDTSKYEVIYFNKLNYIVPYATQGGLPIIYDLNNNIINKVTKDNHSYHTWELHFIVFPFKKYSVILLFIDSYAKKRYEKFIEQFNKLDNSEKIALINHLIILYTEEIYFSPLVPESVGKNKELRINARTGILDRTYFIRDRWISQSEILGWDCVNSNNYDLMRYKIVPNLLSEEYAL